LAYPTGGGRLARDCAPDKIEIDSRIRALGIVRRSWRGGNFEPRRALPGFPHALGGNEFGVQRRLWEMFAFASGAAAAAACRKGMTALWRVSRHQDPPENPVSRGVRWRDALIWSISLGVGAAVSRLVAQRGAAAAWQAATGSQPPGLNDRSE
jgi:hypothetical protein